ALSATTELCVGDLALALDVTEDQVSYALKMLRLAGLVAFRKDGRMVCYRLSDGFPHPMLEQCLRELLTIAMPDGERYCRYWTPWVARWRPPGRWPGRSPGR